MKKIGWILAILFLIAGFITLQRFQTVESLKKITSFEDCRAAQYPVRESYPPQCTTPDGRVFTQQVENEQAHTDVIKVANPRPNQKISNPFMISGEARGSWYFEATFPVELVDETNNSIAKGYATAQGEWMTESFVPFQAELPFEKPASAKGKLIIKNANPSGLAENEKEVVIPVVF